MGFAERLRSLREDNDERQKDIAKLLNVSISMISFYESGVHFPRDEKILLKLCSHFNVSADYLIGLTNIPNYHSVNNVTKKILQLSSDSITELEKYIDYLKYKEKN